MQVEQIERYGRADQAPRSKVTNFEVDLTSVLLIMGVQ